MAIKQPISVVIVTFNGIDHLPKLASSLAPELDSDDEVVIFDNASTDGTPDWVRASWPTARLVESKSNLLFAAGNNAATLHANNDVLFYLNQDTEVTPGLLGRLRSLVTPARAVTVAQSFPWSEEQVAPFMDWSGCLLWRKSDVTEEPTNTISGGAFALHRSTIELLGGVPFDSRIPHYCEDTNLGLRLSGAGVAIVAVVEPYVIHHSTPSKGSSWSDFVRAIKIQRNLLLAFGYALGWKRTAMRLPALLASGWRKADVDGNGNFVRRAGLSVATVVGFLRAIADRPTPVEGWRDSLGS
ncbi:MAG: glycosyltransferase [Acidimicrobiia bacterium]|nr:glycosyltransferase [Acidimicrobiia bacterium]